MAVIKIYKNYNSYFNRTLVKEEPTSENLVYQDTVNFNPNDGVNTSFVAGKQNQRYSASGNYAFVEEDGKITHWFILEAKRVRGGQYKLTLRRDLMRDFFTQWSNSTAKINRAIVSDNSPYIFNSENVDFNQIKQSETLLKDDTGMAWICGFIDKATPETSIQTVSTIIPDIVVDTLESINGYKAFGKTLYKASDFDYENSAFSIYIYNQIYANVRIKNKAYLYVNDKFTGSSADITYVMPYDEDSYTIGVSSSGELTESSTYDKFLLELNEKNLKIKSAVANTASVESMVINDWKKNTILISDKYTEETEEVDNVITTEEFEYLNSLKNGLIIKVTGTSPVKYYKINKTFQDGVYAFQFNEGTCASAVNNILQTLSIAHKGSKASYSAQLKSVGIIFSLEEIQEINVNINIPSEDKRYHNKTAPFDMFIIPYADGITVTDGSKIEDGTYEKKYITNRLSALTIASNIATKLSTYCYDVQILPYCPITGYIMDGEIFNLNNQEENRRLFIYEENSNEIVCMMIWATSSSGSKIIELENPVTSNNKKIDNSCDVYRIVSPNYNGQFEFSAVKNDGLSAVQINYTYLPYSSFIHVAPNFGGLYGGNFKDSRGMICQGDFSITYLSNAWENYVVNNKNYNEIFDRSIQNLEVNRKAERYEQATNALSNVISTGVDVGLKTGNVYAGIGAGVLTGVGEAVDYQVSEMLYKEKISYAKDLQSLQLGNIQAMPNSIAKTTAYVEINKIFPLIEYYTCTNEEKQAFANLIINYSMSVGVVDTPSNYFENSWEYLGMKDRGFISLELIEINDVDEDDNVITELAKELRLGVYLK